MLEFCHCFVIRDITDGSRSEIQFRNEESDTSSGTSGTELYTRSCREGRYILLGRTYSSHKNEHLFFLLGTSSMIGLGTGDDDDLKKKSIDSDF